MVDQQPDDIPGTPDLQPRSSVQDDDRPRRTIPLPLNKPLSPPRDRSELNLIDANSAGPQRRPSAHRELSSESSAMNSIDMMTTRTTRTGRISKAKKGLKVHRCDQCPRVYTRAEHLRRHQQNHGESSLRCPQCDKTFHREDLLSRHIFKHNQPGESQKASSIRSNDSRASSVADQSAPSTLSISSTTGYTTSLPVTTSTVHAYSHPSTSLRYNESLFTPASGYQLPVSYVSSAPTSHPTCAATSAPATSAPAVVSESSVQGGILNTDLPIIPKFAASQDRSIYNQPAPPAWATEIDPTFIGSTTFSPSSGAQSPWLSQPAGLSPGPAIVEPHHDYPFGAGLYQFLPVGFSPESLQPPMFDHLEFDKLSSQTSNSSSPGPTLAVPPTLFPVPLNGSETSLQAYLGISLSEHRKATYREAYFRHFHPHFPILHRQIFRQQLQYPEQYLLDAAVMAIGAQYTDEPFVASSDSKILHEKCQELILENKATFCSAPRLEVMQAAVLVEFLSHFKAKRAPEALSEVFISVYDKLWELHSHNEAHRASAIDNLMAIPPHTGEDTIRSLWQEWIDVVSHERLLAAAYVLDSYHALLLVRPNHAIADSGLNLYMPVPLSLWEASNPARWAQALRSPSVQGASFKHSTVSIYRMLDEADNLQFRCDVFQSSVVLACYAASSNFQLAAAASSSFQLQDPFLPAPLHSLFELSAVDVLARFLSAHSSVRIMHHTIRLVLCTPLRALIATSGESWFFSKRLAGEAHVAADEFKALKGQLRAWTVVPDLSSTSPYVRAISSALEIVQLAITTGNPHTALAFGPEMGLYFAALVLWATTYAGLSRAQACGQQLPRDDETAEFEPPRAEDRVRTWLPMGHRDTAAAVAAAAGNIVGYYPDGNVVQTPIPPLAMLDSWRLGVGSVIRWAAWVLSGAGHRTSGAGELIEGAVGVLEKLGRSGWSNTTLWF